VDFWKSNSYAKAIDQLIPAYDAKGLPLNGAKVKSTNSHYAIISLIFAGNR
jgi:hypothetical protein